MNIQVFLNPTTERVYDQDEDVFEAIVACYGEEREAESDEEVEEVPKVSVTEALSALTTLKIYEEQKETGDPTLSKALRTQERELHLTKQAGMHQGRLDS